MHGEKSDSLHKLGCSHIQIVEQIDLWISNVHSVLSRPDAFIQASPRACIMWGPSQIQISSKLFLKMFPWKVNSLRIHCLFCQPTFTWNINLYSKISLQIELQIEWTLSGQRLQKTTAEHYVGLHCLLDESICVWLLFSYDILHQHVSLSFHDHFTMSSTSCNQISFPSMQTLIN